MKITLVLMVILSFTKIGLGQNGLEESDEVILNPKGIWMLHEMEYIFACEGKIDISIDDQAMVVANMGTCDSSKLNEEKLRPYFYNLFWSGIENNEKYTGISIINESISWKVDQMGFAYIQPVIISIFGRNFILLNDSTYKVERGGRVIVENFKTSYFDNCVYKTDTLNAISMAQQWGSRWRINAPCSPFYLTLAQVKMWGDDDKWKYYSLPCDRNGQSKLRTIALSNDGQFRWNWGLGSMETLTAGNYTIQQDSILTLQTDYKLMDEFIEEYKAQFPGTSVGTKYLIQRKYVIKEERIYFVNEYR